MTTRFHIVYACCRMVGKFEVLRALSRSVSITVCCNVTPYSLYVKYQVLKSTKIHGGASQKTIM
jgi:hypothetical protein